MNEKKWVSIATTWSMMLELQTKQNELFQNLVNFLMDEETQDAKETNESLLEGV